MINTDLATEVEALRAKLAGTAEALRAVEARSFVTKLRAFQSAHLTMWGTAPSETAIARAARVSRRQFFEAKCGLLAADSAITERLLDVFESGRRFDPPRCGRPPKPRH